MSNIQLIDKSLVSKNGVDTFKKNIIAALDSGELNPLELKAAFKAIEKVAEGIKEKLDKLSVEEASKYEKTFSLFGTEYELCENLGVKYDYSGCCHKEWELLDWEITNKTKRKKEVEEELKAMKQAKTVVDEDSGEVYKIYPPVKKSTTGVKVTLK